MNNSTSGIITHSPRSRGMRRRRSRRSTVQIGGQATMVDGVEVDRLSYINTALEALPGKALRDYFVPVMRLRKSLLMRRKATKERLPSDPKLLDKKAADALNALAKSLSDAAGEVLNDAPFPLDPAAFVELLRDKVEPVSFEPDSVLSYPGEPAEVLYVYVVVAGSVKATQFQPLRRAGAAGTADRRQYFTSNMETVKLCGGGINIESAFTLAAEAAEASGAAGAFGANSDAVSASNVTSAIQRSLKRASRAVGQPTLQATRTDILRAPLVLGAGEALSLAPLKCTSIVASTTAPTGRPAKGEGQYESFTDTYRVRVCDVHAALLSLASVEMEQRRPKARDASAAWFSAPPGTVPPRGAHRTLADFLAAARIKTLGAYYNQNEVLMRQSWLLQDTPPPTIRNLISHLAPRTYMPGEVIACAHTSSSVARQLCFLRRGRILIMETPRSHRASSGGSLARPNAILLAAGGNSMCVCGEDPSTTGSKVLEVVEAGASFGELSVLFGEARNYVLRAATVCDVWCLSHSSFARTMRRDDALRKSLVEKAGALRMKWLGEQRFTPALTEQLRAASEVLHPLSDMVLRLVQERLEPVVYSPGTLVASTSERCQHMLFIIQGRISSICEGVASYGPGDIIGEGCLIPHRWPLGLSSRTMVEGWRLSREGLLEALERADQLHAYSGEVTSQAQLYMKQIFGNPVPPVPTDVVGRQVMPIVAAAPGGVGYPEYARLVAEVQLKATCFMFRDYVKWEDINYATMDRSQGSSSGARGDALARELVISRMRVNVAALQPNNHHATRNASTAPLAEKLASHISGGGTETARRRSQKMPDQGPSGGGGSHAAGSGCNVAKLMGSAASSGRRGTATSEPGEDAVKSAKSLAKRRRRNNTGSCAFLVNPGVTSAPFASRDQSRMMGTSGGGSSARHAPAPALPADFVWESEGCGVGPLQRSASFVEMSLDNLRRGQQLPARISQFTVTLRERDRLLHTESKQEAALEKQFGKAESSLTAVMVGANQPPVATTQPFGCDLMSTRSQLPAAVLYDNKPTPVHLFLCAEPPRSEISMAEAITIGYIAQLPDTQHIQSCVSFVDPDVTIGLPSHRGRRYVMAVTPNDRHHKHNFLFAASVFEDASRTEEQLQEQRGREEQSKRKAQRLLGIMRSNIETRPDRYGGHQQHAPPRDPGDSASPLPPGDMYDHQAMTDDAFHSLSREQSLTVDGTPQLSRRHSLSRDREHSLSGASTPSPFRGSPGRSPRKKEEGFIRLLGRDHLKALDMLYAKFKLPWQTPGQPAEAPSAPFNWDSNVSGRDRVDSAATSGMHERISQATTRTGSAEGVDATAMMVTTATSRDHWRSLQYFDGFQQPTTDTTDTTAFAHSGSIFTQPAPHLESDLERYLRGNDTVLFVDGYGALNPPGPGHHEAAVVLRGGGAAEGCSSAGPSSHPGSAFRRGSSTHGAGGTLSSSTTGIYDEITPHHAHHTIDRHGSSTRLTPQDFMMPDMDEANAMMRRIQRDVEGLNAVAKEQARERERNRERQEQLGQHSKEVEAALSTPSMEEAQLLNDWRTAFVAMARDRYHTTPIPKALIPQAGPNHLKHGIRLLIQQDAEEVRQAAALKGVEVWQEHVLDTKMGGGLSSGKQKGPAAARRVITAIGTNQLGYPATPLTNPAEHLDADQYQRWVANREEFFSNYARQAEHISVVNAAALELLGPQFPQPPELEEEKGRVLAVDI